MSAYFLLFFTAYNTNINLQNVMGNSLLIFVATVTAVNAIFILSMLVKTSIQKCKRFKAKKRFLERVRELERTRQLRY